MPEIRPSSNRYIYIACPWTPVGGGMYKVADYLIQSQSPRSPAQLRPLDTRGGSNPLFSMWVLFTALLKLLQGRLSGRLAGVHVNMGERLSLFRKSVIVIACRALGIPVVLHLHAQMYPFYRRLPAVLQAITRWVFSLPSAVLVIGAAARRFVTGELHVPAERVEVVVNGVPGPVVAPLHTREPAVSRLLFVGRLCEAKGVSDLLNALAHPDLDVGRLRLTLAGNGDIAGYQANAEALGLGDAVQFAGWCDQDRVAALLRDADILVLPSHDEVLPLVVLEALAQGVAVVCTPVGELPSTLVDGVHALFVPHADPTTLAHALQGLIEAPQVVDSLARNGRALYERQFSLERFCANIAEVHQRHFGVSARSEEPVAIAQELAP
jgi:glycosyltransferase involved in cell wall biosynthesis